MAIFYTEKNKANFAKKATKATAYTSTKNAKSNPILTTQSLDYQGLGVAKVDGKTWFIENALPTEKVEIQIIEEKRQYGRGKAVKFHQQSANRQTPTCPHYARCGGCQIQHIPLDLQRETKQNALFQRLQKLQSTPIDFQPMIVGKDKGYRRRARLSMTWEKGEISLGFRLQNSNQITPLTECEVLEPSLSALIPKLHSLFNQWQKPKLLGHIELVQADNTIAMLLRNKGKLGETDLARLMDFAQAEDLSLFTMCEEDCIEHLCGELPYYTVNGLTLGFSVRDFIQVNRELNQKMVEKALNWLELSSQDRVLDLFCGMGNFTLPIAQKAGYIVGVEGVEAMVAQAQQNAKCNGLDNVAFFQTNLDESFAQQAWAAESFNKVLLDPARNGAFFALTHLCELNAQTIVYVSCNPATLVRDAEKLLQSGYQIEKLAMIDMFPHTGHLESIVQFSKGKTK